MHFEPVSFKKRIGKWADSEAEFRQHMARRHESIKLLNAGNGAGFFAALLFLSTGTAHLHSRFFAKICMSIFFIGLIGYIVSVISYTLFEAFIESAIWHLRETGDADDEKVLSALQEASGVNKWTQYGVFLSLVCFIIAVCISFFGIVIFL